MERAQADDTLAERLAGGLSRLAAVARQLDWQTAATFGLTPTQADILAFVVHRPNGVRLSDAAAHAGVSKATASEAVTALERKRLLRKYADAHDGRALAIKATVRGRHLIEAWPSSFAPVVAGLAPQEQETVFALVVKMIWQLQQRELIAPQRLCVSCRYFRENVAPGSATPHFCALVEAPLADRDLRIDCPEHESAA